jgi:hypothetical protein
MKSPKGQLFSAYFLLAGAFLAGTFLAGAAFLAGFLTTILIKILRYKH